MIRFAALSCLACLALFASPAQSQDRIRILVEHNGEHDAGEQFAYLLRDQFRGSSSFEVVSATPTFTIVLTTIDGSSLTHQPSIAYSVVLIYNQRLDVGLYYERAFLTSMLGMCPETLLRQCAVDTYISTASETELALEDMANALNAETRRLFEASRPPSD